MAKSSSRKSTAKRGAAKRGTGKRGSGKRELIKPGRGGARFTRRSAGGQFTEQDSVGRSLRTDRRKKAKTKVKSGQGDRGDRPTGRGTSKK